MRPPAPRWISRAWPVLNHWLSASPPEGDYAASANRFARAAAVPGRPWRLDAAFAGGQSRDWDLAAAHLIVQEADGNMTALSGDPILYNRPDVTHGILVAAGRDRHADIVTHFRADPQP